MNNSINNFLMNHAAQKMVETFLFCCFDRDVGQYLKKNLWVWSITSPFFPRLHGGPKKRVVQPRLIGPAAKTSKKESNSVSDQTTESLTAAVAASAASAAIAATQPFLKVTKGCTDYMI